LFDIVDNFVCIPEEHPRLRELAGNVERWTGTY